MTKLIRTLSICFVALCAMTPLASQAANLYAIVVADTTDDDIGTSVEIDFRNMRKELSKAATYAGLDLKEVTLQGSQVHAHKMLQKLQSIDVKEDDVVFFLYSGHGYRLDSKGDSPWPNMYFSIDDEGVEYEKMLEILNDKQPRLLITITDICNSFIPDVYAPHPVTRGMMLERAKNIPRIKNNYHHLFVDFKGTINITSASVSEYAIGYASDIGGLFTFTFINMLDNEVESTSKASWDHILTRTHDAIKKEEHPYYECSDPELCIDSIKRYGKESG